MRMSDQSCTHFMEWVNENKKSKTQSFDAYVVEHQGKKSLLLNLHTDSPFNYQFIFDIVKEEDSSPDLGGEIWNALVERRQKKKKRKT
jgi:hypothetical protein